MIWLFCIAAIILDQGTKHLAVRYLKNASPVVLIENHIELRYLENRGAAFGILQGNKTFFVVVTVVVCIVLLVYYFKQGSHLHHLVRWSIVLIVAGAIGNLIDRVRQSYVVDFISLKFGGLYDFPIFNLADICVTVGCSLLIVYILFIESKYEA